MNLPNCDNFCTAEKCLELEQKIAELQVQINELTSLVNNHINQDIPEAHNYTPLVLVESFIEQNNILTTSVTIDDINDFDQVNLPIHQESNLSLSGIFQSEILTLTIADGESSAITQINIPLPEVPEHKESNLAINGSFQSEILTLTVADGESSASTQISIPLNEISNITNNNNYGGGSGGDLNCPNIETKIEECCEQILDAINNLQINLTNEINNTETIIVNDVSEVKDAVCIDITGITSGEYSCEFEADEEGNVIPTYAVSKVKEKSYQGQGFLGIHEILKLIQENLTYLHGDICKAVDPLMKINLEDMYNFCDSSEIKREDFPDSKQGEDEYKQALK